MIIAGLCGGVDRPTENRFGVTPYAFHDAACVLLDNGEVIAGIEEERLNRIKHTTRCPLSALRACLDERGLTLAQVDAFAFGARESYLDEVLARRYQIARTIGLQSGRQFLQRLLEEEFGQRLDPARFHFVDHHYAHACSAYYPSGFDAALVFTTDGVGDGLSGSLSIGNGDQLQLLHTFDEEESLGFFYVHVTRYLGYDLFDEYKVMGLAPYGDDRRYASIFESLYELLPGGLYRFDRERLRTLWQQLPARPSGEGFTQSDMDVAKAAQITLERIVGHVLTYYQRLTGLSSLCMAGGVALNCHMNGELLRQGLFERIFVQPAAHDAGLSLGAALHVHHAGTSSPASRPRVPLRHVYWGGHSGSPADIAALLRRWRDFLVCEQVDDPYTVAATMLSEGVILGWVRGRSEFGPRALGNRSILADPRPAANKDRINALVKKREAFRPFAPSVLAEEAATYFELPAGETSFPFMLFTVPVREPYRALLGAITHVDGSARLQTVSRDDNPCYWRLIDAFRERTGIPVLLNTSFNNFAEPIVETADDALTCFLTTGLSALVLEHWIVTKRPHARQALGSCAITLPPYVKLHDAPAAALDVVADPRRWWSRWRPWRRARDTSAAAAPAGPVVGNTFNQREYPVSDQVLAVLLAADGHRPLDTLMDASGLQGDAAARLACLETIEQLWERRLVRLMP
jgi:carbamoyltransferase